MLTEDQLYWLERRLVDQREVVKCSVAGGDSIRCMAAHTLPSNSATGPAVLVGVEVDRLPTTGYPGAASIGVAVDVLS